MAVAKLICGDCGTPLGSGDTRCSSCGAVIEPPASVQPAPAAVAGGRCDVCGRQNPAGSTVCDSCGARLAGSAKEKRASVRQRKQREDVARKSDRPGPHAPTGALKHFEPWQVISAIAVVGLIAYLAYVNTGAEGNTSRIAAPAPPVKAPAPMLQDVGPLQQAVDANPKDAAALLRLANALHDNRTFGRAAEVYRRYLALVPGNPDARVDLGVCYFEMGQQDSAQAGKYFAMAVQEMQTAVKATPTHQPSAFNLAVVYLHMGDVEESNRWFRRAVELNKDSELGTRAQRILEQHSMMK
jgi:cytochrome c-type biogenesis protein CcmH/NrfG